MCRCHAQTIFITETDDATAKTERGWYMVGTSAGGPYENTINPASGLAASTPQGCPASPTIWAMVIDFALAYARKCGG